MRAASLIVIVAVALPFLLGPFWAYQLGLYALYAAAAVGVLNKLIQESIPSAYSSMGGAVKPPTLIPIPVPAR